MSLSTFRLIFFAGILSLGLSPVFTWFTSRLGFFDIPGSAPHKQHLEPVPIAGGSVILVTVFLITGIYGVIRQPLIWVILLPSLIVFLFGVWDDVRGLSAPWKLFGQLLAASLLISLDIQVRLFDTAQWLNILITIFWVVGITNAYNFVDSKDGLATGLAGIAAAFFMLVTIESGQVHLSLLSAVILGACIGTHFFNAMPARYFLGDSGAQWLGFVLAALAIAYNPVGFLRIQSWFIPILLVGVPIFDTTLVVFSRLRLKQPIYKGRSDHTYHRLVAIGMHPNRAVMSMHLTATLLGCLAFITLSLPVLAANAVFAICLTLGAYGILFLDGRKRWP